MRVDKIHQWFDGLLIESVDPILAITGTRDKASGCESPQAVRHARLLDFGRCHELADSERALSQCSDDMEAIVVAKNTEESRVGLAHAAVVVAEFAMAHSFIHMMCSSYVIFKFYELKRHVFATWLPLNRPNGVVHKEPVAMPGIL